MHFATVAMRSPFTMPARAGCVKGRRMATVPKCQFDLEVCGGTFVNAPCVVEGNLVSGRTYHDHGHYIGKWIAMLEQARAEAGASKSTKQLQPA